MSRKRKPKTTTQTEKPLTDNTVSTKATGSIAQKTSRSTNSTGKSRNNRKRGLKEWAKDTSDGEIQDMAKQIVQNDDGLPLLQRLRNATIVPGFGMSVPAFRRYSSTDVETYIPLGIEHGYYTPVGQEATSELYPQISNLFLQRVLTRLTNLGYENDYTVTQLRTFFNGVALGLQMVMFITELRTLQKYGEIHSSGPVSAMCTSAINGRLIAQHRRAIKLISALPFDPKWEEAYIKGFGITTLSDSPFGPLRMFAPKVFQPDDDTTYTATNLANALQASLDAFFSDQTNTELASVLSVIYPPRPELPEVYDNYITYNGATVNNILNLPYNDGTTYAPNFSDTEAVRYFYRRSVVPHGMYTYAPDNDVLAILQGTVWTRRYTALENVESSVAVDNDATARAVVQDGELWSNYGRVWNSNISLIDSPAPSVAHVFTNFTSIATGVASSLLNG